MNEHILSETEEEEGPLSHWGAPVEYDGAWQPQFFFFITAVADMTDKMWEHLGTGRQMDWVICPIRSIRESQSGYNQNR